MLYRDMNHTPRKRDSLDVSPTYSPSSARVACIVTSTTSAANTSSNCLQIKKITLAYSNPFAKQQQQQQQRRGNC
jgi:hypothetical protein